MWQATSLWHPRLLAAPTLVVLLLVAPATAAVRTPGYPTVISGWKDGPITVPTETASMASLSLPAGTWVAWAKLYVTLNVDDAGREVECWLRGRAAETINRRVVSIGTGSYIAPPTQAVALSTWTTLGSAGGQLTVGCRTSAGGATAHWIKIMAMKVGTLKRVDMATGTTWSTGTGQPLAIVADRTGVIQLPAYQSKLLGQLSLSSGGWYVRASFTHFEPAAGGTADCRLRVGKVVKDRSYDGPDVIQKVTTMDTAFWLSGSASARVTCLTDAQGGGAAGQTARDLRITAVKLGSLVVASGRGTLTYGSGAPKAWYKTASQQTLSQPGWKSIASLTVPAGSWMVLSKAKVGGGDWVNATNCRLTAGADYDISQQIGGTPDLALGVVHSFASDGRVKLHCNWPLATSTDTAVVSNVRVTAFKLFSLQNVPL